MTRAELERGREWTIERVTSGEEPPSSWYQLMKLQEAVNAVLSGMAPAQPAARTEPSAPRRAGSLRLVIANGPLEAPKPRLAERVVPLPS